MLHHRQTVQIIYIVIREVSRTLSRIVVSDIWSICTGVAIVALTDAASNATFDEKDHVNVGEQLQLDSRAFQHGVACESRYGIVVSWIGVVCSVEAEEIDESKSYLTAHDMFSDGDISFHGKWK